MPTFSIVIPCFNASATISDTLKSIQDQSENDWEALCIDDGSTDETAAVIAAHAASDPRICLIEAEGKGPSDARNQGALHCATGEIIAFCDADDLWDKDKLADLRDTFLDPAVDGAFGVVGFFTTKPGDAVTRSTTPAAPLSVRMLIGENPVCTMSNMSVRRRVFEASGGFDASMVHNEDLEWLIRLVGQGARVVGRDVFHTWYRASTGGLSADLAAMSAGREAALATAARFGVQPDARGDAIHFRYLARRALRLGYGGQTALRMALLGLRSNPVGFLFPLRRGGATLLASLLACILPRCLSRALFSA